MLKEEQVQFDRIHDTAQIYRVLLSAMARPGTVASIGSEVVKMGRTVPGENVALALAITLLDHEASHYIDPNKQAHLADEIAQLTFSPRAEAGEADYVFVDSSEQSTEVVSLIRQVKRGSLWQPEESATLLIMVEEAASTSEAESNLLLSGPGIPDQILCSVKGMPPGWTEERHRRIEEYPLGIDLVFYTDQGNILALPRTTKVKEVTSSWAM